MRVFRSPLLVAVAMTAVVAVSPALAGGPPSNIGSASSYGLDKNFTLVGYTSLGERGMNSPVAVAGRCVYVGDRYYGSVRPGGGVAVVDASDPAHPREVGTIPPVANSTQRELRADAGLGVLVVESYDPNLGDGVTGPSVNNLKIYDIRNCLHPKLLSTFDFGARDPHEFFLWKDRSHPGRALAYVTFTIFKPDLMVIDLTDPARPTLVGAYDLGADAAYNTQNVVDESGSGYVHSISVSDDGTRALVSDWDWGFYELDTSLLAHPPAQAAGVNAAVVKPVSPLPLQYGHDVHSAVQVPGRPFVVLGQEDYANAGRGCPFGWMRLADVSNPASPRLVGTFKIPENNPSTCGKKNGTFSMHNQTPFRDVVLASWYSGGLRAVDIANPAHPFEDGAFVPQPTFTPALRDDRLFFPAHPQPGLLPTDTSRGSSSADPWTGSMWSYPVVQNGLIYVVDIDLGLYILRYTGPHANEVATAAFVEGNSSPSRYSAATRPIVRPAAQWTLIDAQTVAGPRLILAPYRTSSYRLAAAHGFICL